MEKEKPARFQFRLRTLLIALVIVAFAIGIWFTFPRPLLDSGHHRPGLDAIVEAKNIVNRLVVSVEHFKMDYNQYPWPDDAPPMGTTMADILRELAPTNPGITKGRKHTINTKTETYFEVSCKRLKNGTLIDPWGNEYMIVYDEKTKSPMIWSKGANGKDETSEDRRDDIANRSSDDIAYARQKR